MVRTPRDIDAELQALKDRAKALKARKTTQLGEVVVASGAAWLHIEVLAGALLAIAKEADQETVEGWRRQGQAFFQGRAKPRKARRPSSDGPGDQKNAADDRQS